MQEHTLYFLGNPYFLEHDVSLTKKTTPFTPFTQVICIFPQTYGDLHNLASSRPRGEYALLLIDMDHTYVDLAVDLALLLYRHTGNMPVCAYVHMEESGERCMSVKYPVPIE
jgi:hypothetical protein